MMMVFNWEYRSNGYIENWWCELGSAECYVQEDRYQNYLRGARVQKSPRRFVYNAFKAGYAIAIHLDEREIQITRFATNVREKTLFSEITDPDLRDAMEVVAEANDAPVKFLVIMYLQTTGRDDLAEEISQGAVDDLMKPSVKKIAP